MVISTAYLSDFASEPSLRNDVDYFNYLKNMPKEYYSFSELFELIKPSSVDISTLDNDFLYSEIGDVSKTGDVTPNLLNFNNRNLLNESLFKKIEKGDIKSVVLGDILISKVRPNLKKYVFIDEELRNQYFTTAFITIRPKKNGAILYYSLRTLFFDNLMAISRQGKGYPTLNENDLVLMKFDKKIIDNLFSKVTEIDEIISKNHRRIAVIKKGLSSTSSFILNEFNNAFGSDSSLIGSIRKGMSYGTQQFNNTLMNSFKCDLSALSNYKTIRLSARSQNPIFSKLDNELKNFECIEFKNIVREPIHNGDSPVYVDNGEIPVIKTMHLSDLGIKQEYEGFVSSEQYDSTPDAAIRKGDLLVCNIGKCSLGKCVINDLDDKLFAASEVMIIRVDESKFNPEFVQFFLRSAYGIYQFEREYTGTTNQIHISPEIVEKFIIPNIDLLTQNQIVDKIKNEYNKQKTINDEIEKLRTQIETIICS